MMSTLWLLSFAFPCVCFGLGGILRSHSVMESNARRLLLRKHSTTAEMRLKTLVFPRQQKQARHLTHGMPFPLLHPRQP